MSQPGNTELSMSAFSPVPSHRLVCCNQDGKGLQGCPHQVPVDRDEVYKEIFEQAENFKKYQKN